MHSCFKNAALCSAWRSISNPRTQGILPGAQALVRISFVELFGKLPPTPSLYILYNFTFLNVFTHFYIFSYLFNTFLHAFTSFCTF